jgi:kynurenine formamidase
MSLTDFRELSDRVRNWGRWGEDDELGTLNLITDDVVRSAAREVRRGALFSLGMQFGSPGPQRSSPVRNDPIHLMTVDGGDAATLASLEQPTGLGRAADYIAMRGGSDLFRFNDDYIMMPLQAATQWDALAHVYYEGELYNGFAASTVTSQGALHCGIDKVQRKGIVSRGVLVDAAGYREARGRQGDTSPILPEELDEILQDQTTTVSPGDVVVVRTGWMRNFAASPDAVAESSGLGWQCAGWLYDHGIAAVAADHPTVEHSGGHLPGAYLPLHLLALRDMGLPLGELWDLEELAADCRSDGRFSFQLCAPPLKIVGAVGSPVNPVALK